MEYTTLSNGVKAPLLGLGTFQLSLADTENAVYEAWIPELHNKDSRKELA